MNKPETNQRNIFQNQEFVIQKVSPFTFLGWLDNWIKNQSRQTSWAKAFEDKPNTVPYVVGTMKLSLDGGIIPIYIYNNKRKYEEFEVKLTIVEIKEGVRVTCNYSQNITEFVANMLISIQMNYPDSKFIPQKTKTIKGRPSTDKEVKKKTVEKWLKSGKGNISQEVFAGQNAISVPTLRRWIKEYEKGNL